MSSGSPRHLLEYNSAPFLKHYNGRVKFCRDCVYHRSLRKQPRIFFLMKPNETFYGTDDTVEFVLHTRSDPKIVYEKSDGAINNDAK